MTLGKKKNILDEDKYLDDLEFIIKRDFFPDSELLELHLKYFDAMEAQDFCAVKEIQMKLNRINETFENCKNIDNTLKYGKSSSVPYKNPSAREERDLHLNEYLAKNTSEDNDSYSELQQKAIERQMAKLSWSFKAAKEYNENRLKSLQQSDNVLAIEDRKTTKYQAKKAYEKFLEYKVFNPVFFNPDSVALSGEEKLHLAGSKSQIVYENTRFKTPLTMVKSRPKTNHIKPKVPGKIGHDGKELAYGSTPRVGGFSILGRTDTPGWDDMEDITELPESPMVSRFRIQEPSEREKLATEMASRASRNHRGKKQQALERVRSSLLRRPTSSRTGTSHSFVSPAAVRLLNRMTPSASPAGTARSSRPGSMLLAAGLAATKRDVSSRTADDPRLFSSSITDNLLDHL